MSIPATAASATWQVPHAKAVVAGGVVPAAPSVGFGTAPGWPWLEFPRVAGWVEVVGVEAETAIGQVVVKVDSPITMAARQRLGDLARAAQAAAAARILAAESVQVRAARQGLRLAAFEAKARRAWAA